MRWHSISKRARIECDRHCIPLLVLFVCSFRLDCLCRWNGALWRHGSVRDWYGTRLHNRKSWCFRGVRIRCRTWVLYASLLTRSGWDASEG